MVFSLTLYIIIILVTTYYRKYNNPQECKHLSTMEVYFLHTLCLSVSLINRRLSPISSSKIQWQDCNSIIFIITTCLIQDVCEQLKGEWEEDVSMLAWKYSFHLCSYTVIIFGCHGVWEIWSLARRQSSAATLSLEKVEQGISWWASISGAILSWVWVKVVIQASSVAEFSYVTKFWPKRWRRMGCCMANVKKQFLVSCGSLSPFFFIPFLLCWEWLSHHLEPWG